MTINKIHLGDRAKEVLENDAFKLAFEEYEKLIYERFKQCPVRDAEGLQKLKIYQQVLSEWKQILISTFETGEMQKLELAHQRTMAEKAKDFLSGSWLAE